MPAARWLDVTTVGRIARVLRESKGLRRSYRPYPPIASLKRNLPMTTDQEKDLASLQNYIGRHALASCMNDAKWREMESAVLSAIGSVEFRVKCVCDETGPAATWERSFPWHLPSPRESIEWLDIRRVRNVRLGRLVADRSDDLTGSISDALFSCGVPFSVEPDAIRVWGYVRPGITPNWCVSRTLTYEENDDGQVRPPAESPLGGQTASDE